MIAGAVDHQFGQMVAFEIKRAEFGMVNAEDFIFNLAEFARAGGGLPVDFGEMIGKRPGHHDFAHVVHEAGHIIGVFGLRVDAGGDFAGEDGGADAVLPEFAPGKITLPGEPLEILDDRRDHRELPDLPDAEIEHGFLNAVDRRVQAVIDGVDQPQQARGEAGVAPDDLGDVRGVALFNDQQPLERLVDAAQRGQRRAAGKLRQNLLLANRSNAY